MARIKYKEAAGLEIKRGKPAKGKKPNYKELKKLYVKESRSIREVAELLGCSKDMIFEALREYGIERRSGIKRSKLRNFDLAELKNEVRKRSYKDVARRLEVDISTIRRYIKKSESNQM